jgi:hypothetical protein
VAVLLLLGIGAILAVRAFTKPSATAPLPSMTVARSTEAPTNPKLDDIPPPPPPPEPLPEAGSGVRTIYVPNAGCEARCPGAASSELYQALQVRGSQARRCYDQALLRDSSLKGHVTIDVRVGPTGNVCSVAVASNDMGTQAVANCAANIFRSSTYPAPRGGCVDANVPLSFVPPGR